MKKISMILGLAIMFVACGEKKENEALKAQIAELNAENEALANEALDKTITLDDYKAMLTEIDENIAAIDSKNDTITLMLGSEDEGLGEDILLHLQHVHGSLLNSKHKVAKMQQNIKNLQADENLDDAVIIDLANQVDQAAEAILAQDDVIDVLNSAVEAEGIDIAVLSTAYANQALISEALYTAINTGNVILGTKDELKTLGYLNEEGGFIGIGRVKTISTDLDGNWFIAVPIDATDSIPLNCKKATLITEHPEGSYEFSGDDKNVESLVILDKAAFWDLSNYLIIETVERK